MVEFDMEPDTISEKLELMDMKHSDSQEMLMSAHSRLDGIETRQDIIIGGLVALAAGTIAAPHIKRGLSRLRQRRRTKLAAA